MISTVSRLPADHRPAIGIAIHQDLVRCLQAQRKRAQEIAAILGWCLDFRIKCDPAEAVRAVRIMGGYNDLDPRRFARLLREIDRIAGRKYYGVVDFQPNTNNGSLAHDVLIGNEGSFVLYVRAYGIHWNAELRTYERDAWTPQQVAQLTAAARRARADEFWQLTEDPNTFRIWWD